MAERESWCMNSRAAPHLIPFAGGWEAHQHKHCLWIVTPDDRGFERAFNEVAEALAASFAELGGSAPIVTSPDDWNGRIPVVIGGNVLWRLGYPPMPSDSIILNLEQMTPGSVWVNERYLPVLRSFPTLDFSQRNLAALRRLGIEHARLLELGYSRQLTRINLAPVKDVDVFFYGSRNDRRWAILNALAARGLVVAYSDKAYGEDRDAVVARAKIVLNIHYLDGNAFEIVRVSYLLANRVCVVSEGRDDDPDVAHLRGGVEFAEYGALVDRCVELLRDDARREAVATAGFEKFASRRQSFLLRNCMDEAAIFVREQQQRR